MSDLEIINTTISAGTTLSAPVKIGTKTIVGFVMPPIWTSGQLSFRVSADGGVTFLQFVDTGNNPVALATPSANTFVNINPTMFAGVNELELVCATAPSANATIGVAVRSVAF